MGREDRVGKLEGRDTVVEMRTCHYRGPVTREMREMRVTPVVKVLDTTHA